MLLFQFVPCAKSPLLAPSPSSSSSSRAKCPRTPKRARSALVSCSSVPPLEQEPSHASASDSSQIEQQLRSLGAHAAADLFYVALSSQGPALLNSTWTQIAHVFEQRDVRGEVLSRIAQRLGLQTLLNLKVPDVCAALDLLAELKLSTEQRNLVLSQRPDLLCNAKKARNAFDALLDAGMTVKDVKGVVLRWPGVLLLDSARIERCVRFMMSSWVGMPKQGVRPLLKRASWILVYDVDGEMAPGALFLKELGVEKVDQVVRAAPLILGIGRARMQEVVQFLEDTGLRKEQVKAICRSFAPILTCNVAQLEEGLNFLKMEVGMEKHDLCKVIRAFPAILTLDLDDCRKIVQLFEDRGVRNVNRIVKSLPPVLGYDLADVKRKMDFLESAGLRISNVLRFPGVFSYNLEERIIPRVLFLKAKRISVWRAGINVVLSLTEAEFCARFGKGWVEGEFTQFKSAVVGKAKKKRTRQAEQKGETQVRRKRRFRATLSRLPWNELK